MIKKDGLNNSDKALITVALWMCAIALFVVALSLPMLPNDVSIFAMNEHYSKFYNLLLLLFPLIPAAIILISASFKKRNRLQNSFLSISLFCIMMSICFDSIIIYGVMKQFASSSSVQLVNFHALATIIVSFVLSMLFAVLPAMLSKTVDSIAARDLKGFKYRLALNIYRFWNIGAYGYFLCAIATALIPRIYCYIPLVICVVVYAVFLCVFRSDKQENRNEEQA